MNTSAWGSELSYNYLDASWLKLKPDQSAAAQSDGYRLTTSAPLDGGNFLRASYARVESDSKAKTSLTTIGLGGSTRLQAGTDGYGVLSYEEVDNKATAAGSVADDKGASLELGIRWSAGDSMQLDLGGRYVKLDRAGEDIQWFGEGLIHLTPGFALSGRYTWAEADTRYSIGLRLLQR
ncbi:MAG: hypothetical protein ACSHXK_06525 [Oceanococcus sp.]